jgi:hypothetical protein
LSDAFIKGVRVHGTLFDSLLFENRRSRHKTSFFESAKGRIFPSVWHPLDLEFLTDFEDETAIFGRVLFFFPHHVPQDRSR